MDKQAVQNEFFAIFVILSIIFFYLVAPADGEAEIAVVVDEENEDADEPLIGEIAEDDEEG